MKNKLELPPSKAPARINSVKLPRLTMPPTASGLPFAIVGIAASSEELQALQSFLAALPSDRGLAYIMILPVAPESVTFATHLLSQPATLPVLLIEDGMPVRPDHIYVSHRPRITLLRGHRLRLSKPIQPGRHRPADEFFRSLAAAQSERAICIMLNGPGSDGAAGAQAVKAAGGLCVAQAPRTPRFEGMPRSIRGADLADFVLHPEQMPEVIVRFSRNPFLNGHKGRDLDEKTEQKAFNDIVVNLRSQVLHDFSAYKKATLIRRIQRRISLSQFSRMKDYSAYLERTPVEARALADEMLIRVTGFFRDPATWEALRQLVIVPLAAERPAGSCIRAWAPACATGEEAYSLAIVLREAAEAAGKTFDIRIFATDASESSLSRARSGVYPGDIENDISPERLHRFFEPVDGSYRISQELRDLVVFTPQDVLHDPPFSNLDLCVCRNLFSDLEPAGQWRALAQIHFGLRNRGVLLLGRRESVSGQNTLFEVITKRHRLFRRIGPTPNGSDDYSPQDPPALHEAADKAGAVLSRAGVIQSARSALLEHFGPSAVVIDQQQQIIYLHGNTGPYMEAHPSGPKGSLLPRLREPLRNCVQQLLQEVMGKTSPPPVHALATDSSGSQRSVEISVVALTPQRDTSHYLISFVEQSPRTFAGARHSAPIAPGRKLAVELKQTRDELHNTIARLRTNNDEIRASHQETVSMNADLQSANEELQSRKEELLLLNEEMITINAQLHAKMEELEASTNDMSSLLSSTNIAVVFLDLKLRIRRYTPAVNDLFRLAPHDNGRPLRDVPLRFTDPALFADARAVLNDQAPPEIEVVSDIGRTYIRQALPYRTFDNRLNGVVLTFVDITQRKYAEMALSANEAQYRLILEGIKEYAIFLLDREGRIASWAAGAERILGYTEAEALGQHLRIIHTAEDRTATMAEKELGEAEKNNTVFVERWHVRKDGGRFWGTGTLSTLHDQSGQSYGFVKVVRDNTDRKFFEEALKQAKMYAENANASKDYFLANVSHELRTPLATIMLWAKLLAAHANPDPEFLKEGLEAIDKSSKEQQALIEDLMDTSKIVAGKLRLELREMDLNQLIHDSFMAINLTATEKGLTLDEKLDPEVGVVRADPRRLRQVLMNVLNNAVKFTPGGGHISVKSERIGAIVEIHVSDTGQGISKEFISRVFERYMQVEQGNVPSSGGMGLGLAIARQLVESHSGTIRAHSDGLGKGTLFSIHIHLPRICPTPLLPTATPDLACALDGLRILLVEDAPSTRKALTAVLTRAGAKVVAVDAAAPALSSFEEQCPDLILSDIGLGKVSGHELIRQIRAREIERKIPAVPAVALTAYADEKNRQRALECGFQECLTKPVEPHALLSVLAALRPPT